METIVESCYSQVLKRKPDSKGLEHYVDKLTSGELNAESLLQILRDSDEAQQLLAKDNHRGFAQTTVDVNSFLECQIVNGKVLAKIPNGATASAKFISHGRQFVGAEQDWTQLSDYEVFQIVKNGSVWFLVNDGKPTESIPLNVVDQTRLDITPILKMTVRPQLYLGQAFGQSVTSVIPDVTEMIQIQSISNTPNGGVKFCIVAPLPAVAQQLTTLSVFSASVEWIPVADPPRKGRLQRHVGFFTARFRMFDTQDPIVRWPPSAFPIPVSINVDNYRDAVEEGIRLWEAPLRLALKLSDTAPVFDFSPGMDEDKSTLRVVESRSGGTTLGIASFPNDPRSGDIYRALIEVLTAFPDQSAADNDIVTFKNISRTTAHEMGHALGLRHNFVNLEKGTGVMDYNFQEELTRDQLSSAEKMHIEYGYDETLTDKQLDELALKILPLFGTDDESYENANVSSMVFDAQDQLRLCEQFGNFLDEFRQLKPPSTASPLPAEFAFVPNLSSNRNSAPLLAAYAAFRFDGVIAYFGGVKIDGLGLASVSPDDQRRAVRAYVKLLSHLFITGTEYSQLLKKSGPDFAPATDDGTRTRKSPDMLAIFESLASTAFFKLLDPAVIRRLVMQDQSGSINKWSAKEAIEFLRITLAAVKTPAKKMLQSMFESTLAANQGTFPFGFNISASGMESKHKSESESEIESEIESGNESRNLCVSTSHHNNHKMYKSAYAQLAQYMRIAPKTRCNCK